MFEYLIPAYAILSVTLFLCPIKRKKGFTHPLFLKALRGQGVLHVSHRGGSRERLENTMEAFHHAIKSGTDMLEMDVCYSKDRKVVPIPTP